MRHELHYTSAVRGLVPTASGFCTVKATYGMPLQLRELLESISSYRHRYPPNDPRASTNPVNYSLLRAKAGETHWLILSRIQDAGLDHTNRSNFFAHHIAVSSDDLPAADPTCLLGQHTILLPGWDQRVEELAQCRPLAGGKELLRPSLSWQAIAGDAGWAGAVAQAVMDKKRVCIICGEDQPMLPLIAEFVALLPDDKRWHATFSTYFASLPPGVECQLRCVIAGSPESSDVAAATATRINLTQPLGAPPDSPLVEAARTGRGSVQPPKARKVAVASNDSPPQRSTRSVGSTMPTAASTARQPHHDQIPLAVADEATSDDIHGGETTAGRVVWIAAGVAAGVLLGALLATPFAARLFNQNQDLQRQNQALAGQLVSAEQQRDDTAKRLTDEEKSSRMWNERAREKEQEIHKLRTDTTSLDLTRTHVKDLEQRIAGMEKEREELKTSIESLEREKGNLQQQNQKKDSELANLKASNGKPAAETGTAAPKKATLKTPLPEPTVSQPVTVTALLPQRIGLSEQPDQPKELDIERRPEDWHVTWTENARITKLAKLSMAPKTGELRFEWLPAAREHAKAKEFYEILRKCVLQLHWESGRSETVLLDIPQAENK